MRRKHFCVAPRPVCFETIAHSDHNMPSDGRRGPKVRRVPWEIDLEFNINDKETRVVRSQVV